MQVPLEVSYRGVDKTPEIQSLIEEKTAKLEEICDYMIACRVAVEKPQEHQRQGNPHRVRLDISIPPNKDVVVTKEPSDMDMHDPLSVVIREAFNAARRQVKEIVERQAGRTKSHPEQAAGAIVAKLFEDQEYGFLKTVDGRDIYFHKNAVAGDEFDRLDIGTGVRFVESEGEMGPQASTVQIVAKPGSRASKTEEDEVEPPRGWEKND